MGLNFDLYELNIFKILKQCSVFWQTAEHLRFITLWVVKLILLIFCVSLSSLKIFEWVFLHVLVLFPVGKSRKISVMYHSLPLM